MRPHAYSTFSRPRASSPCASAQCLSVLARDDPGQFVGVRDEQLAKGEENARS